MKKQSLRKLLAMLLCLSMALSLLPAGALATGQGDGSLGVPPTTSSENAEEVKDTEDKEEDKQEDDVIDGEQDDVLTDVTEDDALADTTEDDALEIDLRSAPVPGDGARDEWVQSEYTKVGGNAVCELTANGERRLKPLSGNGNNAGSDKPFPAVFSNPTMDAALAAAEGEKRLSFRMVPTANNDDICFGIFLNYVAPVSATARVDGIFIGYNKAGGWFAQFYGGNNSYPGITGLPNLVSGASYDFEVSWTDATVTSLKVNGSTGTITGDLATNVATVTAALGVVDKVGIKAGKNAAGMTELLLSNVRYTGQALTTGYTVSGKVTDNGNPAKPIEGAGVVIGGKSAVTDANGIYTIDGGDSFLPGTYDISVSMDEYVTTTDSITVGSTDVTDADFVLTPIPVNSGVLSTDAMDVTVDLDFPRVIRYNMKGENDGKVFYGQTTPLDTIKINNVSVQPAVVSEISEDGTKVTYQMFATGTNIDAIITAELVADGNTLTFNITEVMNNFDRLQYPVESIEIPNHSLISVRSTQPGANFKGAQQAANTTVSGDTFVDVVNGNPAGQNGQRYFFGFVSNDELSAGLTSNSDYGTASAGKDTYPILVSAEDKGSYKTLSLGSTLWYYDRKTRSSDNSDAMNRDIDGTDMAVIGPMDSQMPLFAKVVIAGEGNGDGQIDWQDGAIAFRDTIMHKPANSDNMADVVSTRIAMNFGSQAQNPFLTTLDNAKRLALHTDGLGQAILLKGYGSEGHDSGHPDYDNVGERMGGVADFNTLTQEGKKIGARFGIHINASEFYPESKAFSEEMVQRKDDEGNPLRYGWNWIDQGVGINGLYDLATGNRAVRFDALYNAVGNYSEGGLDFVYVDVWGNGTSGKEDSWQTRKLSETIISHGWRIAHEWSWANPYESTFQHWTGDFPYGNYGDKGALNSEVMRFLQNTRKDSFVPDFAWYGGAANAPLLGGPSMQGFEGWQGDGEYDMASYNVFNQMIYTKFLQHYDVMKWTNATSAVAIPYAVNNGDAQSNTSNWTPEVQIELERGGDKVVVTRGLDEEIDQAYAYGTEEQQITYRSRTITLNGKVILTGAPKAGDFKLPVKDTMQYLIPWNWDTEGKTVAADQEKFYHWNAEGGESTWELPDDWAELADVKVYKLTDTGRTEERTVKVEGGWVTITAEAETPYVVTRGAKAPDITYTAAGTHLTDMSFNAAALEPNWIVSGKGTAAIVKTSKEIPMLQMTGEVSVSQELTDLVPGQTYAVYVGVDNRSDARASISITADGKELASNFTLRSIAPNYISAYVHAVAHPVEAGTSMFQNMYVFFTAPAAGIATTLTLSRAAGEGNTYFDDVRVVESAAQNYTYGPDGMVTKFTQDFENVAQGEYPFVVGPIEGMADNRQHLSEKHAPFTQAGWDAKKLDDVLEGNWSLKVNGLCSRKQWNDTDKVVETVYKAGLTFQTIPQTFYFEPGVTYSISFDYQMGSAGTFEAVTGVGVYDSNKVTVVPLKEALGNADGLAKTQRVTFTVVGDASGQSWFGIRSTRVLADYDPTDGVNHEPGNNNANISGDEQNFGGYKDFILDNLVIEVSKTNKDELAKLLAVANGMQQADYSGNWSTFAAIRTSAQSVMNNQNATQAQVDSVIKALKSAMDALVKLVGAINGTITSGGAPVVGATITLENSDYSPAGSTAVTDAEGKYSFKDIAVKSYKLRLSAQGYDVKTVDVVAMAGQNVTKDETLTAQSELAYANFFDSGDVSMLKAMESVNESHMSAEAVQYGGSGAAKITFIDSTSRDVNNLVDKTVKMENGTLSVDVTPLDTGLRFGFTLRGQDATHRLFLGQFDAEGEYGWEFWNADSGAGSRYLTLAGSGPALSVGVTRRLELTLNGNILNLKVDGVPVVQNVDITKGGAGSAIAPQAKPGYVGFNKERSTNTSFIIDNFCLISSDPAQAGSQTISGAVLGEGGTPISGAQVSVLGADDVVITRTSTKLDGTYTTAAVPVGEYTVEISAPSYVTQTKPATVVDAPVALGTVTLTVDVTQLQALYDANKDKTQGYYTDVSWALFQSKLTQAKTVLDAPKAVDVAKAYNELKAAIAALAEATLDKSLLRTYYNSFNGYIKSDYKETGWDDFVAALQAASDVLKNTKATQYQVDAAKDALIAAERALEKISQGGGTGSGSSSGNTTTETAKNPDGSTTTTVTNKTTGTVTETTTGTDGTKVVTETKKDGTSTTVVTLPKNPEGTVTLPGNPASVGDTITIKTDKSADVVIPVENAKPGIVPVIVKADGTEEIVKNSVTGKNGVTLSLDGSAVIKLKDNSKTFADVAANNWAADAVAFATSRELFNGTGGDSFSPMGDMTRSMLITVLARLDGQDTTGGEAWYSKALAWGVETGITDGSNADASINRESLVVMLYRYAKAEKVDGMALSEFPDAGDVSSWATEAMSWAVANGILNGAGGKLNPTATASRAEVATILQRFVSL